MSAPAEFVGDLLHGAQRRDVVRCLRLFRVGDDEFKLLRDDVRRLIAHHRPSNAGDSHHVTSWTHPWGEMLQYSLLTSSGRTDDFSTDHDLSCRGKWFFYAAAYPALDQLIADLPHLVNFRIHSLEPGAALSAHQEHIPFRTHEGTIGGRIRFHLPIDTNARAELSLDGKVFHLEPGVIHLVNQGCVHTACNYGALPRVHLVWDALLTEDTYHFLFQPGTAPDYLVPFSARHRLPSSRRTEAIPPHRRLPPRVSAAAADQLDLCQPQ